VLLVPFRCSGPGGCWLELEALSLRSLLPQVVLLDYSGFLRGTRRSSSVVDGFAMQNVSGRVSPVIAIDCPHASAIAACASC
jgi:hypothetical protein